MTEIDPREVTLMAKRNLIRQATIDAYMALRDELDLRHEISSDGLEVMKARFDRLLVEIDEKILAEGKAE